MLKETYDYSILRSGCSHLIQSTGPNAVVHFHKFYKSFHANSILPTNRLCFKWIYLNWIKVSMDGAPCCDSPLSVQTGSAGLCRVQFMGAISHFLLFFLRFSSFFLPFICFPFSRQVPTLQAVTSKFFRKKKMTISNHPSLDLLAN